MRADDWSHGQSASICAKRLARRQGDGNGFLPGLVAVVWLMLAASLNGAENLVPDASFESALPPCWAQRSGTSYYADKQKVADAADGQMVLVIEAWDHKGSRVLAAPVDLPDDAAGGIACSGTVRIRSFGPLQGATLEMALFDEPGRKRLATIGRMGLDGSGQWQTLRGEGIRLEPKVRKVRLAFVVSGPQDASRVEIDLVGLFAGQNPGSVTDNSDLTMLEAEDLADGVAWKVVEHYTCWYRGSPSRMKMLAGSQPLRPEQNRRATSRLTIRKPGRHKLWVRFHSGDHGGEFQVTMRQGGADRLGTDRASQRRGIRALGLVVGRVRGGLAAGRDRIGPDPAGQRGQRPRAQLERTPEGALRVRLPWNVCDAVVLRKSSATVPTAGPHP